MNNDKELPLEKNNVKPFVNEENITNNINHNNRLGENRVFRKTLLLLFY